MTVRKNNYKNNKTVSLGDGLINGQGKGAISTCRYGLFPMSYNGCEIIAVYNLCRLSGIDAELAEIANEIYPYGNVLWGLFGTNPFLLSKYFKKHHISINRTTDFNLFVHSMTPGRKGIISFWTGINCMSSLHTVAVEMKDDGLTVYNRSNGKTEPCDYTSVRMFIKSKSFIVGYYI